MDSHISLSVGSPEEVDALLERVWNLGARVVKPGAPTGQGGYSGCFTDPDGFLWEVAYPRRPCVAPTGCSC